MGLPGDVKLGGEGAVWERLLAGELAPGRRRPPAVGDPLTLSLSGSEDARLLLRALAAGEALTWGRDMHRPSAF